MLKSDINYFNLTEIEIEMNDMYIMFMYNLYFFELHL